MSDDCVPLMVPYPNSSAFALPPSFPGRRSNPPKRPRTRPRLPVKHPIPPNCKLPIHSPVPLQVRSPDDAPAPFWAAAGIEAMAALLAFALCRATHLPVLGSNFMLNPTTLLNALVAAVPFSLAFWALEKAPTGITAATEARFRHFFQRRSLWEVAIFCACVALGEELLFRAWMLAGLLGWGFAPAYALIVSALVFGALHAYTKVYMVLATIAGFLFGSMFLVTGSVLEPLIVHFLYDFCTILLMQRRWVVQSQ